MVRVINNNLWSPIPWGWGCGGHQCGSNNWMNNMLKYNFMFQMMNNMQYMFRCYMTPPQQQSSFYPGLYLGGGGGAMPQNYEEYLQQQQDTQDFAQLKASYSGFKFTNIGGEYQARLTSDPSVRFSGSSVLELMDEMNEYIDANPDKFKTKPAKVENTDDDTTTRTRTTTTTDNDGAGAPPATNTANSSVKVPSTWHRRGITEDWFNTNFTENNITAPTPAQILKACTTGLNMDNIENNQALIQDMIKYNPSCFEENGTPKTPFPWNKLDIPSIEDLKNTYGLTEKTNTENNTADPNNKPFYGFESNSKFYIQKGNQGSGTTCARIEESGGCCSWDANLYIYDGHPYAGKWKFKDGDNGNGDQINIGKFSMTSDGRMKCSINCKAIKNETNGTVLYIKTGTNGTMTIQKSEGSNEYIPLEEFFCGY